MRTKNDSIKRTSKLKQTLKSRMREIRTYGSVRVLPLDTYKVWGVILLDGNCCS